MHKSNETVGDGVDVSEVKHVNHKFNTLNRLMHKPDKSIKVRIVVSELKHVV